MVTIIGEQLVLSVVLFVLFFGFFVFIFSAGRSLALVAGLFRLVGALFAAPVRYLHVAAVRILAYSNAPRPAPSDKQFLLATILAISSGIVFVVAIAILAAGVAGAWQATYPPTLRIQRAELDRVRIQLRADLAQTQAQSQELATQLAGETEFDRRMRQMNERAAQLRSTIQGARESLDKGNTQEWQAVRSHLDQIGATAWIGRSAMHRPRSVIFWNGWTIPHFERASATMSGGGRSYTTWSGRSALKNVKIREGSWWPGKRRFPIKIIRRVSHEAVPHKNDSWDPIYLAHGCRERGQGGRRHRDQSRWRSPLLCPVPC